MGEEDNYPSPEHGGRGGCRASDISKGTTALLGMCLGALLFYACARLCVRACAFTRRACVRVDNVYACTCACACVHASLPPSLALSLSSTLIHFRSRSLARELPPSLPSSLPPSLPPSFIFPRPSLCLSCFVSLVVLEFPMRCLSCSVLYCGYATFCCGSVVV